ncbi:MAG: ABC transporter permease, partial [Solirubrobacterales bacterium]|nr:ABC transporter permease [Solirubrobacterales bacterium]
SEIQAIQGVGSVNFESKAQAYQQMKAQNPQGGWSLVSKNPLPDTFHVMPSNPSQALAIRSAIMAHGHMIDPSIKNVSNHVSDTKTLLHVTSLLTIVAVVVCSLFIIASMLLIGNTIRLSLYARRREVEVMKLVGATDWFIRWPFVIEGVLVGAAGALLAVIALAVAKFGIVDPLAGNWVGNLHTMSFVGLVGVLILAGVVVSALGSGISLRRFLRV